MYKLPSSAGVPVIIFRAATSIRQVVSRISKRWRQNQQRRWDVRGQLCAGVDDYCARPNTYTSIIIFQNRLRCSVAGFRDWRVSNFKKFPDGRKPTDYLRIGTIFRWQKKKRILRHKSKLLKVVNEIFNLIASGNAAAWTFASLRQSL